MSPVHCRVHTHALTLNLDWTKQACFWNCGWKLFVHPSLTSENLAIRQVPVLLSVSKICFYRSTRAFIHINRLWSMSHTWSVGSKSTWAALSYNYIEANGLIESSQSFTVECVRKSQVRPTHRSCQQKKIQTVVATFSPCHLVDLHSHGLAVLVAWGFIGVLEGSGCARETHLDWWASYSLLRQALPVTYLYCSFRQTRGMQTQSSALVFFFSLKHGYYNTDACACRKMTT